jgi:hypothetical protein
MMRAPSPAASSRPSCGVKAARGLYRVAKSFTSVDAGDAVRPHVAEMKRSLRSRRPRKPAAAPAPSETPTVTKH